MSYTELPPCHTEDGGVTGYGIGFDPARLDGTEATLVVTCNRMECGATEDIHKSRVHLDINQDSAFCAEALRRSCKLLNGIYTEA